ncbi:MAG: ABC-type transport auxiliary lipoprotein family protein [Rhodobacterales bacterium]|nr:ABC-type transport auxiliary lipoprotein family protein [Rhodobacterales bacterium]
MQHQNLTRRFAMLGAMASLGGCSALSSLNAAATPLNTYDLAPAPGSTAGRRSGRTVLVAQPDAPAGINTDRIMIRQGASFISYLPNARWADDLPNVMQSLLIRSIAGTGRMGYVGVSEGGPVPDYALLTRIDSFEVTVAGAAVIAQVDISLTMLRDSDQTALKTRNFRNQVGAGSDQPQVIVAAFQAILNALLPEMADWVAAT